MVWKSGRTWTQGLRNAQDHSDMSAVVDTTRNVSYHERGTDRDATQDDARAHQLLSRERSRVPQRLSSGHHWFRG